MQVFRGTLKEYREELFPLFKKHWEEVGLAGSGKELELNVNEEWYTRLENNHQFLGIGLKNDEGKLVGYISFFVYMHYHHSDTAFATTDCFMIEKEYRNTSAYRSILKMFELAEKILRLEFGVKYMQFGFSKNNPLDFLAKRMGYEPSDVMYLKKLELDDNVSKGIK